MNNITEKSFLQAINSIKSRYELQIVNILIRNSIKYEKVFISQTLIAREVGVTRETVNRFIKDLAEKQLIIKVKRYNTTSLYFVNRLFYKFQEKLKHLFSALKQWNIYTLTYFLSGLKSAFLGHITSSINRYINIPVVSICNRERYSSKSKSSQTGNRDFNKNIQKRRVMNQIEISSTLRKVTEILNLTKWGQIKLIPFQDEALEAVLQQIEFIKKARSPFDVFFMACKSHSEQNNIPIDWNLYYQFKEFYHMPADAKFTIIPNKKNTPPVLVTKVPEIIIPDQEKELQKTIQADQQGKFDKFKAMFDIDPTEFFTPKEEPPKKQSFVDQSSIYNVSYWKRFIPKRE